MQMDWYRLRTNRPIFPRLDHCRPRYLSENKQLGVKNGF